MERDNYDGNFGKDPNCFCGAPITGKQLFCVVCLIQKYKDRVNLIEDNETRKQVMEEIRLLETTGKGSY